MITFIMGVLVGGIGVWLYLSKNPQALKIVDQYVDGSKVPEIPPVGAARPDAREDRAENLGVIMDMAKQSGEVSTGAVAQALGITDLEAARYLTTLEGDGRLVQAGLRGQQVVYRVKE